jgi:hypothetical protein
MQHQSHAQSMEELKESKGLFTLAIFPAILGAIFVL